MFIEGFTIWEDYKFWLGLIGSITGIISLILALIRAKRMKRNEVRIENAELRIKRDERIKKLAIDYLMGCEKAAGNTEKKDNTHPEWKELSTSLKIGDIETEKFRITFIEENFQSLPRLTTDKTHVFHWYKWYIEIKEFQYEFDSYAIFGELTKLLKRPGDIEFEVNCTLPDWLNDIENDFCVLVTFNTHTQY